MASCISARVLCCCCMAKSQNCLLRPWRKEYYLDEEEHASDDQPKCWQMNILLMSSVAVNCISSVTRSVACCTKLKTLTADPLSKRKKHKCINRITEQTVMNKHSIVLWYSATAEILFTCNGTLFKDFFFYPYRKRALIYWENLPLLHLCNTATTTPACRPPHRVAFPETVWSCLGPGPPPSAWVNIGAAQWWLCGHCGTLGWDSSKRRSS